ncbi:DUF4198 domain-containing protein [Robiginitalea sp. IMCC43444]|uniref:DUF4198 domain-containing protein n=1 Tax=Robiginitalea sp. IMCC43444 TaxID=3459121 RepID=UPI00404393A1
MKRKIFAVLAFLLLCSHDMFLKPSSYFLKPHSESRIELFNGSFEKSENIIDRNRMQDVSLLGNGKRMALDSTQWSEKDSVTILNFKTGAEGTWVAGVSTRPRNIEMKAADFNSYLEHDGIIDLLAYRKDNDLLDQDAIEKYSKHVKTIFQVGNAKSEDWKSPLGYPLEFIPLENPYQIHAGHQLPLKLLWKGSPLANQLVYVGNNSEPEKGHSHDGVTKHTHNAPSGNHRHSGVHSYRTDADGIFRIDLTEKGTWHMRTIYLVESQEAGLTHESNWATLSFGVGEGHSHSNNANHAHEEHAESSGIPTNLLGIGSILVLGLLFLAFNRQKK